MCRGSLSSGASLYRGSLSGGSLSGGLCPEASLSRGSLSRGSLSRGALSRRSLSRGCLSGGSLSGGVSVRETPLDRKPPYGNERVVHILLECILACLFSRRLIFI